MLSKIMKHCLLLVQIVLLCLCSPHTKGESSLQQQQQCALVERSGIAYHVTPNNAMNAMLGSTDEVESFFDLAFERTHLHLSHSKRVNRYAWMQYYRRFLPAMDIDLILSYNISAINSTSPLLPQHDVDILRVAERAPGIHAWLPVSVPTQLDSLRSAVRDGGVLQLHHMSSRSRQVTYFSDALRAFWAVPVSANLAFYPPRTVAEPSPAPALLASDVFMIVIEGNAVITLFENYFAYPCEHHIESVHVHRAATKNLKGRNVINVDEGDVLYIPRGTAFDVRTIDSFAIVLCFEIHTEQRLVFHGLLRAVNIAQRMSDILNVEISPNKIEKGIEGSSLLWSDILTTSVKIAAEFTLSMRRHLPVTGNILNIMNKIGVNGESILQDSIGRFVRAARYALFEPMLEVLSGDDDNEGAMAPMEIISWARNLQNNKNDFSRAKTTFEMCLQDLKYDSAMLSDVITSMSLDWYDLDVLERKSELRSREHSLTRHGQGLANDTYC